MDDSQLPNAIAPRVPVADKSILQEPCAYNAPTKSPVPVTVIAHSPVADTTSERLAVDVRVISICQSQLTHITASPVAVSLFSENETIYPAFLGSIQPL